MVKKLLLGLLVLIVSVSLGFSAAEPAVLASLAAPGVIYFEKGGNIDSVDLSEESLNRYELFTLALPQQILDSEIELAHAFSLNPARFIRFAWKAYGIYNSYFNLDFGSLDGTIFFDFCMVPEAGRAYLGMTYDDVSLSYVDKENNGTDAALDGDVEINISIFTEPVADISIETDALRISGNRDYDGNTLNIKIYLNEKSVSKVIEDNDIDMQKAKEDVVAIFLNTPIAKELGFDYFSEIDDVITFARRNNALDLLEVSAFAYASKNIGLDYLAIMADAVSSEVYVDGKYLKNIKLEEAAGIVSMIMGIVS